MKRSTKVTKSLRFIIEYKTQLNNIYNDPLGKLLTTKRNISIHRTGVPIQGRFKRVIHETINISDSVSIEVRDKYGNLKMRSEPTKSEKKPELQMTETLPDNTLLQNSDGVEWYFDDYQNDNVVITYNKFLDLIKTIITVI